MDDALNDDKKSDLEDDNLGSDHERYHFDEGEDGDSRIDDEFDDGERIDDPEGMLDESRRSKDPGSKK